MKRKSNITILTILVTTSNNFFTETSCLGEHGVALGAEKRGLFPGAPIPRRALQGPY